MPFTRIAVREGKPAAYRAALVDGVHRALMHTFNVPEDDIFMVVTEHTAENFFFGRHYLDIERSDDLVMIQITANNTRTLEQKKALYRTIAENLAAQPGVRPEDVFISLVEVLKEDWSFGNGIAQYAL
ncbi:4-oxalocrotonate tautomerase [Burkholderia latens]|uniref:4-oxalocrotonate tautomerase n=1 Tax=Burkholderia latens TaxID=488446 RepID=A0AAP1C727_9BURK|nr:tautomerase family protein [Burkholderia latens]AIO39164.1 tautomerase enzyme family protein [Burkholderia cenocepacia]KVA10001.1 4-oxalocrotonate tautomerase [Burkholderia latens]MBY4695328.1 tautomerase family protein [Burkholderia latens]QTO45953.1 tautomerase family protein [Burkholderia latens]QTO51307.1 tautomerase family protein [Burkholderia latens]